MAPVGTIDNLEAEVNTLKVQIETISKIIAKEKATTTANE